MAKLDIDEIYVHAVGKMQVHDRMMNLKFALCDENFDKVKIAYDLLKKYKLFPDYIEVSKKCEESEKCRDAGNGYFKNKMDKLALEMYNKAITRAPLDSPQLYIAYSNRSAANYSMKNYTECLKDIERTSGFECNAHLREKLNKRKAMCEKALEESSSGDDNIDELFREKFKLSSDPNETIPAASDCLEISYSEEMGRGVVATRNIRPGEVLVLENPYICMLLEDYYLKYCYGCLKRCDSMIPCDNCCCVMFCNEECKEKAYNNFHKIDCKLMPLLSALKFTKIELLALRAVVRAKLAHDSCESLSQVISEAESEKDPTLKGYSVNQDVKIYNSDDYHTIHMLTTSAENRDMSDIFQKAITAAVFLNFLLKYTNFFSGCGVTNDDNYFTNKCVQLYAGLLLRYSMICPINGINIGAGEDKAGTGLYAFLSLINHSCAPNSMRFSAGPTAMVVVAIRSVKKGQQISNNYREDFSSSPIWERQSSLQSHYKFVCRCEACTNKWPLFDCLGPARLRRKLPQNITIRNKCEALKMIDKLYTYVEAVEQYAPCRDLIQYQNAIINCWLMFETSALK